MNSSMENAILAALYDRFESHPGSPAMALGDLYRALGISPNDRERVSEVLRQLFSLENKGWVKYQILEDGSGGLIEITVVAIKIVKDRRQLQPEISTDDALASAEGAQPAFPSDSSRQPRSVVNWSWPLVASGLSFLVGVSGNLLAAWIQQDLLRNAFTFNRILVILVLTAVALIAGVWTQRHAATHPKRGTFVLAVLIALTAVVTVVFPVLLPDSGGFNYTVQVQALDTGEDIPNAEVRIDVGEGKAPLSGITDANGFARIFVDASYEERPAILIVEAPGFRKHRQEVDLTKDGRTPVVQLEPMP